MDREAWHAANHWVAKSQTRLSDWTELNIDVSESGSFFIFIFIGEANYFTILWWFLPYTDMNQPWVYMCFPSWPSLPPASSSHPSGSSQCTNPEHPVSCIEPGLTICFTYGNIHVSMLFSQVIPPSPSRAESKRLFFISMSLAVSHIGSSLPSF